MFVDVAKALLWSKPLNDFKKQLGEVEEAMGVGLIRPTLILPPILNNGEKTNPYLSGDASTVKVKDAMSAMKFVSRASMADLCLKLGEKVAAGEEVPQWVGITNPSRTSEECSMSWWRRTSHGLKPPRTSRPCPNR